MLGDSAVSRRKFIVLIKSSPLVVLPFGDDSESSPTELAEAVLDGLLQDDLEDEGQAEQVTRTIAAEICEYAESVSALELEQYDEQNLPTAEDLRRVHDIAEILNEHLDAGIDTVPVEQVYDKARAVESYLPVLAAAERLIDESCEFTQEDQAGNYTRLYIAFGVFTAECALFFSSITYRTAFSGTRYLANNLLVHFRDRMTLTLYAILLLSLFTASSSWSVAIPDPRRTVAANSP